MKIPQNRTKIVSTIGPASGEEKIIKEMIKSGMDVARFNFSHGNYKTFEKWTKVLRETSNKLDQPLSILADLQGPRIRIGKLPEKGLKIKDGQEIFIGSQSLKRKDFIPIDYPYLIKDIKPGARVLLCDGLIEIIVTEITSEGLIKGKVIHGGLVTSKKGVNLPNISLSIPTITEKDKKDLLWIVKHKLDFVGLSFVRSGKDIKDLKNLIRKIDKKSEIKIIAKIEKPEAINDIDKILEETDGIMIARGDLGIELPPEEVPIIQKKLIKECLERGKPVITATQMMESMVEKPKPTRAEVSDVANAILDGTDAVMLSEETASGKYPVESVKMMTKIISEIEKEIFSKRELRPRFFEKEEILEFQKGKLVERSPTEAIGATTCELAKYLKAKLIVVATYSGFTAKMIARHRPITPIVALTPNHKVYLELSLLWGVRSFKIGTFHTTDEFFYQAVDLLKEKKLAEKGDLLVITAGHPLAIRGKTNLIKVHRM